MPKRVSKARTLEPRTPSANDFFYSRKIGAPIYTPSGEPQTPNGLYDATKARELQREIAAARLPPDVAAFLCSAAERHVVFDFHRIADFYADADAPVQRLMERSALVIVDFESAVESGWVKLNKKLCALGREARS